MPFSPIPFRLSWQAVPLYIQPINPLQFRGYLNSSAEALSLNKWLPVVVAERWSFAWLGISWEICGVSCYGAGGGWGGRLTTVKTEHCVESAGAELDHNKLVCRETLQAHTNRLTNHE